MKFSGVYENGMVYLAVYDDGFGEQEDCGVSFNRYGAALEYVNRKKHSFINLRVVGLKLVGTENAATTVSC